MIMLINLIAEVLCGLVNFCLLNKKRLGKEKIMENEKCPVCGLNVKKSTVTSTHEDKEYKLCSSWCKKKFENKTELYV